MISFGLFLFELFDKPWNKEYDSDLTNFYKQDIHKHYEGYHISNVIAHKLEGNNGYLLSFQRNGVLEAHHISKEFESGRMLGNHKKCNPRFYSTMINHLKVEGLDKGREIRVTTNDQTQARHYRYLIDKKFGDDYDVHHYDEQVGQHLLHTSHIRSKGNVMIESTAAKYLYWRKQNEDI